MRPGLVIASLVIMPVWPATGGATEIGTYRALGEAALTVTMIVDGHPTLGEPITEKRGPGLICQRMPAAQPKAKPAVHCFHEIDTTSAKVIFDALGVPPMDLAFAGPGGVPMVGASTVEKRDGGLLCRRTTPSVPTPMPTYTCFAR